MPVYKEKNGTWFYTFKKKDVNGNWKNLRKRGFKTKREASAAEREAMSTMFAPVSATFREMTEMWEDYKGASEVTRNKHKEHMQYRFDKYADLPMSKLTRTVMMKFKTEFAKTNFSTTTKNQTLTFIRSVLRFAHQFYGFDDSSIALTSFKKSDEEVLHEFETWTPEEFERFASCVDNELYRLYFTFMYWTGCRRGEAIALQKDCIGDHTVTFKYSQIVQKDGLKPTKGRNKRTIKLDDKLFMQLQPLLKTDGNYVFGGDIGLSPSLIRAEFKKGIEKSGVKQIRLHDMRHSHATWLINNGVNIVAVSRRLGHKDITTTLRVYAHLLESSDNEMIEKINSYKSR
jgi:integrase